MNPHETRLRVRYFEVDPQGVVHHSVYLHYLELGRTEMLRDAGVPYSEVERHGVRLVVTEARVRFVAGARYDDVLVVRTRLERVTRVRVFLAYDVVREGGGEIVCTASTTLAALAADGRPTGIPGAMAAALRAAAGR